MTINVGIKILKKTFFNIINAPLYWAPFSAYPVLALLAHNISQVRWTAGVRPVLVSMAAAAILFGLFRLIFHDGHKAGYVTLGLTALFFTYGQFYDQLNQRNVPHLSLWLGGAWIVLTVLMLLWARRNPLKNLALVFNVVALGLVVYVIYQTVSEIPPRVNFSQPADPNAPVHALHIPEGETPP